MAIFLPTNIKSHLTESYIQENYGELLEHIEYFLSENLTPEMIKEDLDVISLNKKIDDFVEDAHDYIDRVKHSAKKEQDIAGGYALAAMGILLLSYCLVAALPIVSLLGLIASLILSIISLIHSAKANQEYEKIEELKGQLIRVKAKANNEKDKRRIDEVIERITHEMDVHYKRIDAVKSNSTYVYVER